MSDKYSNDSRDARGRSTKYQVGGYVDPSEERAKEAARTHGAQDTGAAGEAYYEGTGQDVGYYAGMTAEEADTQRASDIDEVHKEERRDKNLLGKEAGRFLGKLGWSDKEGILGSEGVLGKPIKKLGKYLGKTLGLSGKRLGKMFSDVHLKEDINFVGKSDSGINVYEWNYENDKENRYRGVLAHELKQNHEDAVIKTDKGLAVDYDKIDVDMEKVKK